jgi:hypothetical protein
MLEYLICMSLKFSSDVAEIRRDDHALKWGGMITTGNKAG